MCNDTFWGQITDSTSWTLGLVDFPRLICLLIATTLDNRATYEDDFILTQLKDNLNIHIETISFKKKGAHYVSFWAQKLTQNVSFWAKKLTYYVSVWIQNVFEWGNFCSNGLFLFLFNSYTIQSMFKLSFSFSIGKNSGKKYWDQKLMKYAGFWTQKLTYYVKFWSQKLCWSILMIPRTGN
jgi:hypothetical protein